MAISESPFVLALTICKGLASVEDIMKRDTEILICVRNNKINKTHPDVVSVPTQRIPSALAREILLGGKESGLIGDTKSIISSKITSEENNGHDIILYLVESLLSKKLGLADGIERGELKFEAMLAGNLIGTANYSNFEKHEGLPPSEELQMLNVVVLIKEGAGIIPSRTVSYDTIKWVKSESFVKMWDGKEVTQIGLSATQALGICVDGLCISSTYDIVSSHLKKDD